MPYQRFRQWTTLKRQMIWTCSHCKRRFYPKTQAWYFATHGPYCDRCRFDPHIIETVEQPNKAYTPKGNWSKRSDA